MFERFKFWLIILIAILLLIYTEPVQNISNYIKYTMASKNDFNITLSLVNPYTKTLASDSSNFLVLKAEVKNSLGKPIPGSTVSFSSSKGTGNFYPSTSRTDVNGNCIVSYSPPEASDKVLSKENKDIEITAKISGTKMSSSVNISLSKVPLIFIHGYNSYAYTFDSMREYLSVNGYEGGAISYSSQKGIIPSAKELESFLKEQKKLYLDKGIQVEKFDIIAHSMGGLVARYYTSSVDYVKNSDVRKMIFVSVPHRGSLWASVGMGFYNDQGISDLIPDNPLLRNYLPEMLNKGLNNTIQVGSIIGQYDELVPLESVSLDEWNIKTEVFNVGDNNLTFEKIMDENLVVNGNHANILNNKKVFERIEEMLEKKLPYPSVRN